MTLRNATVRVSSTRRKAAYTIKKCRSGLLITSGFGFLSASAFVFDTIAGLAATGVSLLILEYCSKEGR